MLFTKESKRVILPVTICVIYLFLLVMRGSGMMDYRLSAGINELWLLLAFPSVECNSVQDAPLETGAAELQEER